MLLPLIIYAIYATSFTMSKAILSYVPPLLYVGTRISVAGVILMCYAIYTHGFTRACATMWNNVWSFGKLMLVQTYIPYTLSFTALKHVTSVEASLVYNISPCITAMLSYMLFHKRLHWIKIVGLVVSMSALVPLFYNRISNVYAGAGGNSKELMLLVIAVASAAYGWIVFSDISSQSHCDASLISSFSLLAGGICMLMTSSIFESWDITLGQSLGEVIALFVMLIIAVDIIFTNVYGYLLAYYTTTFMALLGITLPLFTSLFSWMFLQEHIPSGFVPSCLLMSVGLCCFYYGENTETLQTS